MDEKQVKITIENESDFTDFDSGHKLLEYDSSYNVDLFLAAESEGVEDAGRIEATNCVEVERLKKIKQDPRGYLHRHVDKGQKPRFPSKWLDELRERNKCTYCPLSTSDYDEYKEGYVFSEKGYYHPKRPKCDICNPICRECENSRKTVAYINRTSSDVTTVECSACYKNKDIWRIKPLNQLPEFVIYRVQAYHIDLGTLDIPCPNCLEKTVKNGKGEGMKRKCTNKTCIAKNKKSIYTFRFKKVYEEEILRERVLRLFERRVSFAEIEKMEKVSRHKASKWVFDWLKSLPTKEQHS